MTYSIIKILGEVIKFCVQFCSAIRQGIDVTYTNEMHTFQINTLIRFLTSATCFEPHGFIIRKTVYVAYLYHSERCKNL